MNRAKFAVPALLLLALATPALAQDAVKVDAKHYKVEFENAKVRVLRASYGPHEKSVMHSHPDAVAVFLNDGQVRFTFPGGKTQDAPMKAGTTMWTPATTHLPENVGDKPFEVLVIELKGKPAKK
jgi:quercetin dioxygenase-like cupin family protein